MTVSVALGRRATRLTLAGLGTLLAVGVVTGALVFSLNAAVAPSTVVPVTLANGSNCTGGCTTTLNSAATAATTGTGSLNPVTDRQFLQVVHGATAWNVQVRVLGVTGSIVSDGMTLSIASTSTASLTLNSVTIPTLPQTTGSVPLAGGGGATDVSLLVRGICLGSCVLTLEFILSSGSALYTYPATLTVT